MILLLAACTTATVGNAVDPWVAAVEYTVTGSPSGPEDVLLPHAGWSIDGATGAPSFVSADADRVHDLWWVLPPEASGPGAWAPEQLLVRKGQQQLESQPGGACTVTVDAEPAAQVGPEGSSWQGSFSCEDLAVDQVGGSTGAAWSVAGTFVGGAWNEATSPSTAFQNGSWSATPEVQGAAGVVAAEAMALTLWRDGVWLHVEDGVTEAPPTWNDVQLRLTFSDGAVELEAWASADLDPTALRLRVLAAEEVTAGVQGSDADQTGTDLTVPLFDELATGWNEGVLVVK